MYGYAQPGGNSTYQFLNLSNSARITSLGGKNIVIQDNDLGMAFQNPSLLNSSMDNHLVMNYVDYFSDINYGYFSYAKSIPKMGNFAVGMHYVNYGKFLETDEKGVKIGNFGAAEYALNLFWSTKLPDSSFNFGINIKPLYSVLESYTSFGIAADLGVTYYNPKQLFTAAIVLKNIGTQIKSYTKGNNEPLPFEIELGFSQRLRHAPFRFSFMGQQLQMLDMTYEVKDDQEKTTLNFDNDSTVKKESKYLKYGDMAMRHMIFGVEIIPIEQFFITLGYNYQRRQELKVDTRVSIVGFSWGFGINLRKFSLSYGRSRYHLAGSPNHFSIGINLSEFTKSSSVPRYKKIPLAKPEVIIYE